MARSWQAYDPNPPRHAQNSRWATGLYANEASDGQGLWLGTEQDFHGPHLRYPHHDDRLPSPWRPLDRNLEGSLACTP
jgi:hypothetical protein